uniref:Uncharacterized protein n=1 Tax=Fagus sylvatica TaxID=28930 RepID=A0A2N9GQD1_FAGSY
MHSALSGAFGALFGPFPNPYLPIPFRQFLPIHLLDFASGFAFHLSWRSENQLGPGLNSNIDEWIFFTSLTPFNQFVLLRCPSISEELNRGRIVVRSGGESENDFELEYQRVCVSTEDGGVVSLDWPAKLELKEEHGLDTTFLLVPC